MEYDAVIRDPYTACYKNEIERVQRKCLNLAGFILKMYHPLQDYSPVMTCFGLDLLVDMRIMANFRAFNKLIDGFIDSPELLALINFNITKFSARHTHLFCIPKCTINYSSNKSIHRIMEIANRTIPSLL